MTPPKRKYQNRQKQNLNRATNKAAVLTRTNTKKVHEANPTTTKAIPKHERTPLIDKQQIAQMNQAQLEGAGPGPSNSPVPASSYHGAGAIVEEKQSNARLLIHSSGSSSTMSTYGTTTETVIEKTLQRLNSMSEGLRDKENLIEAPIPVCSTDTNNDDDNNTAISAMDRWAYT